MLDSIWTLCRVQELSQIPSKDAHGLHMLGYRLNTRPPSPPSLSAFQGKGGLRGALAGPFPRGQARCQVPRWAVSTHCPTRTVLKPGPLVVSLVPFQQSDPKGCSPVCSVTAVTHHLSWGQPPGPGSGWLLPQSFMSAGDKWHNLRLSLALIFSFGSFLSLNSNLLLV